MSDIKIVKLVTGEELIGTLEEIDGGHRYRLKKPLAIGLDQQQGRLVFVPFMPYTDAAEEIAFSPTSLLMDPVTPVDSITDDYANATGAIVAPRKSIIRPAGL